jgi:hypothetical protein
LKPIAALRAPTIAIRIQNSLRHGGGPCTASATEVSAKGSAKIECENLIMRPNTSARPSSPIGSGRTIREATSASKGSPSKRLESIHPLGAQLLE